MMVHESAVHPLSPRSVGSSDSSGKHRDKKIDATRMFFDNERERANQRRRASMAAVTQYHEDEEDEISVRSLRSHSRRASMGAAPRGPPGVRVDAHALDSGAPHSRKPRSKKAPPPAPVPVPASSDDGDGYGTDSENAKPSRRARARRASLDLKHQMKFEQQVRRSRRASMSDSLPQYGMDPTDASAVAVPGQMPVMSTKKSKGSRRASLSGGLPRGSHAPVDFAPMITQAPASPRRTSSARQSRRASNGGRSAQMQGVIRSRSSDDIPSKSARGGINPDVLRRMAQMQSDDDDDDDEEVDYGYGNMDRSFSALNYGYEDTGNAAFGYGYAAGGAPSSKLHTQFERRGSHRSQASASSRSSRRRNSTIIRNGTPIVSGMEVSTSSSKPPESDLEDSSDEDQPNYGYSSYGSHQYDSGVESDAQSLGSFRSNARSRRRNSCIIRPDQDPFGASVTATNDPRMSDRDLLAAEDSDGQAAEEIHDDYNDPDSLLNKSGFGKVKKTEEKPVENAEPAISNGPPPHLMPAPGAAQRKNSLGRAAPFTTPHEKLTKDALMNRLTSSTPTGSGEKIPGYSIRNNYNWGEMGLDMSSDDDSSSDQSFGASLYTDSKIIQEIDRYKQRARRRASLEKSCVNMGNLLDEAKKNVQISKKVPNFTPAKGCKNASDFIVRCFCARLRTGIKVVKHNRSRWSKSQLRILYLLPDGKSLSWKPVEGEVDKGKRPKLDLTKCKEVRHAWSPDPDTKKQLGTSVMRKRCKEGSANKSFALIFGKRTLDMTALSSDQCRVLMEGFSALCFRLQLERMEDDTCSDEGRAASVSYMTDDDWASTVYGGESTVSMTQSAVTAGGHVPTQSPWGL